MKVIAPTLACICTSLAIYTSDAHAAPWSRGFVVEWTEPAAWFGGKTEAISSPGPDCPQGSEPKLDFRKILKTSWRTEEEVDFILNPENLSLAKNLGLRGPRKGESVYTNLESVPDRGMRTVVGNVAQGFNLDGNVRTGFKGTGGEQGIDNNFYRAWGCWEMFRGPPGKSFGGQYHNDDMRNGKFTIVMLISGNKDPNNDDDVRLGLYTSKDPIVKDGNGNVAGDYSYKIESDPAHSSVLKARISKGVLEVIAPQDVRWREASLDPVLTLYSARARLKLESDGTLVGMIGGYKPIKEAIDTWITTNPTGVELVSHVDLTAAWYAIKRHADARPDPQTGQNTAISTAIRYSAVPAFIIKPDGSGPMQIVSALKAEAES
ncbi:hypothetical protein ACFPN2_23355 [Steroidobacter flavus]|uniref:Uncharacterized protein n=1 Tax=Steroidobacter flavus TaxID=1842136 RepID=A0ABV8SZG3_9GAMM